MDKRNVVTLVVDGVEYGGWKALRIAAGIERTARSFEMMVTDKWPGGTDKARRIKPGNSVQVFIGQDLVCTGYVDATPVKYDGHAITVGVKGRSKTADLVDCCPVDQGKGGGGSGGSWGDVIGKSGSAARNVVKPAGGGAQYRHQKLEVIAASLAAPYSINVIAETETGAVIADHTVQAGETVFESIDRMMRLRHVLATDNARGDLVFIDIGSEGLATTALEVGRNIVEGSAELDYKDVFSEYIAKGQRPGEEADDDQDVGEFSESASSIADISVGRRRVKVFKQNGAADEGTCADRVDYERAHRAAKALEAIYTLRGTWRQEDGSLWRPNLLVKVKDSIIGIDTQMVVSEIAYSLDESGMACQMRVGPPDGYRTKAAKGKKAAGGGGSGWGDVKGKQ